MTSFDAELHVPSGLTTEAYILRPIVEADAPLDYEAVMESREFLRKWEQSTWPEDDFTVEANREDMVKMERRHNTREAFGYTMMTPDETECLGCVYIFPPAARWFEGAEVTAVGADQWSDCDAMISFWVRQSRLAEHMDRALLESLMSWFDEDWEFAAPIFLANEQFEQQITMIEETALERRFEIKLPTDPGRYFAYA